VETERHERGEAFFRVQLVEASVLARRFLARRQRREPLARDDGGFRAFAPAL
jgi:hypothetical protein